MRALAMTLAPVAGVQGAEFNEPPKLDLGEVHVPALVLGFALLMLALFFKRATPAHR